MWTTIKPFLSHKVSKSSKITLVQSDEIMSVDKNIAQTFDKFYKNAVSSLNIQYDSEFVNKCDGLEDRVEIAIQKFKNHPSIMSTEENIVSQEISNFVKLIFKIFWRNFTTLTGLKMEILGTFLLNA